LEVAENKMWIPTSGEWTVDELEKFVSSVRTIYDCYLILEMATYHELHDKSFDIILDQLSKIERMGNMQSW
jgi:hypothetical protein